MTGKIPKKNPREGIDEYGRTDLHYAESIKELDKLLVEGLDINLQDDNGWCALHFYAQDRRFELMQRLIENGANLNLIDSHGNPPLWTAVMNAKGDYSCVELLLSSGAIFDQKNKHGRSPLDMANTIKAGGLEELFAKYQNG
ncbi:ankyrin repeat domain-containing protein [uncultured Pseudoteredinibacter sp.]|uniref:ankyrin repeat domain-containing protein n=1 Tax=uncultured Pseudoteredinibacter sp. TaxID=1641701 RepID=UPI00262251C9|nr:ankyrin repeat domain-containing protein [uncultured Pseudoteredinibacter sp.]